jgi:predicted transcriptional regulator of viral defense system
MKTLEQYLDALVSRGRYTFSKAEAQNAIQASPKGLIAAAERLRKKRRLLSPKRGFYVILRPEDQAIGAPSPERWIDPLMRHLHADYRISLLRAAAFHGSSHQAAMVFQVIAPKQIKDIVVGRHRIQFVYQEPNAFERANRSEWLSQLKSDAGFAKIAGPELTLLDTARYFHKAAGINGAAQIVHDLGAKADVRKLAAAAKVYENSAVRRLGYLLEHFQIQRQADALVPFAKKAKSIKLLDPASKSLSLIASRSHPSLSNAKWKLYINEAVEIDT